MRQGRTRGPGAAALVLTTVLLLTGCSGDSFRADFARTFGSDEAVADLELSAVEDMPFTGGVSAEIVAREDLADADLTALAGRLSSFASTRPAGDVRILLDARDLTLPVSGDADLTSGRIAAALALRDDPRITALALAADDSEDRISGLSLFLADGATAADAFALARSAPALLPDTPAPHVSVQSADRALLVSGTPGPWLDDADRLWTAISAAVPATGVRADPEHLDVTLASAADLPAATSAAASVPAGAFTVAFSTP
ncbi:hypothetical protein HQQ82_15755 [Rathayibacter sp. VKM Ac-2856]|uniref:hypothetical protein n=1 Tax=unclassified Rathayibacter TaxID=2609250 RepID=UPI001566E719|nr:MULTISPECIES: hypothetical protein [unclassified Rathayibacter]NQX06268.1 hypothetical protein [Rathayibacter sp. VKM Ac-2858]NQX21435.1 hypothetical protein [Rathayibacter sp. VKM Ac-2856]